MRVGFLQSRPKFGAVKTNVNRAVTLLSKVTDALVVLPELFNTGYLFKNREELANLAELVPSGYTTTEIKKIAKKNNLDIVFGIAQKKGRKLYNSAAFVSRRGKVQVYQKIHLYDREKLFFSPGDRLALVKAEETTAGIMVCYDWMFPEVSRALALKGARVICHPSNLVMPWGQEAMRIRCIENGVFAVTANRIGTERRGTVELSFTGKSQVVDPKGEVLLTVGDRSESLKSVEIDIAEADDKSVTANNDRFGDRFPSIYAPLCRKRP